MTDSRFPERWLNDRRFRRLSAEAFRLYVLANTWSASNRTDGALPNEDVTDFPRWWCADAARIAELVTAGLWLESRDGWQIAGFARHQTTAAQLDAAEHARVLARDRKARQRARERVSADSRDVTRDVPRDDTGQDRTGQDRTGQDRRFEGEQEVEVSEPTEPAAPDPVSSSWRGCEQPKCDALATWEDAYGFQVCDEHGVRS